MLPRDDARGLTLASCCSTLTPAEYVAFNGRIARTPPEHAAFNGGNNPRTPTEPEAFNGCSSRNCSISPSFFDQAATNYCTTDEMMMFLHRFGHDITSSSVSSGSSAPEERSSATRHAPVDELLNMNITPDTTMYHHCYQPHHQQHSEEAVLEQRRLTVSSANNTSSLLPEKNKKEEEESNYDTSRYYIGRLTPLPDDFPPPSPEEWDAIIKVVSQLV